MAHIKDRSALVLPCMTPDQFLALKADIAECGVLTPIDIDEHGNVLDGHHRYRACVELGLTDFPTIVRPGLTEEGRRMFARKSNMLRRHLSREQVRQLIVEPDYEQLTKASKGRFVRQVVGRAGDLQRRSSRGLPQVQGAKGLPRARAAETLRVSLSFRQ